MLKPDYCEVAEQDCVNPCGYGISGGGHYDCETSDNADDRPKTRTSCARCGQRCCAKCGRQRSVKGKRGRWCINCIETEKPVPVTKSQTTRRQCALCPWKVSTDPRRIPRGYSADKHAKLKSTIAEPGSIRGVFDDRLRIMACHDNHSLPCVGWLGNQLGPGNNIPLRIAASDGRFGKFELDGDQHERFKDTLPK